MILKQSAMAGTLESSDVQIRVEPNPGSGIAINLESDVLALFGDSIRETVRDVLQEFEVEDAVVSLYDRGALDCTIRARLGCALCRAAGTSYDWSKEDAKECRK